MEQTQLASNIALLKWSGYLRLMLTLVTGFSLTSVGVMTITQSTLSTQALPNPFLEYADIFPGNTLSKTHAKSFSCWGNTTYYGASEMTCRFVPNSDIFSDIQINLTNGTIGKTTFTLRDIPMKFGDLALMFGLPRFRAYPRAVFFFWNKLFGIASTITGGNPATIRSVWSVTFTNKS